jgi:hypothetical protein
MRHPFSKSSFRLFAGILMVGGAFTASRILAPSPAIADARIVIPPDSPTNCPEEGILARASTEAFK